MLTLKTYNQTRQSRFTTFTPVSRGVLQRTCACGTHTMGGGQCDECGKKGLQRKLAIGASNDPLEREADRIADHVMAAPSRSAMSGTVPCIRRSTGKSSASGQLEDTASTGVERVLAGSGRPLDPGLQYDMAQRFNHDFSQVRVHTGAAAEQSARDLNAQAYTVGHNVVFGSGQFAPGTHEGRRLIAHELTHVVQQGTGQVESGSRIQLRPFVPDRALRQQEEAEKEAKKERCAKLADKKRRELRSGTPLTLEEKWEYLWCPAEGLSAMDIVHGALDIAGFIPVLGAIPDGVNAAIYVAEGDWANVGLSAVAMVPAWGDGVKLGVMGGKSVIKISEKAAIQLGEEGIAKGLKEVKAASKAAHAAEEGASQVGKEAVKVEKEAATIEKGGAKTEQEAAEKTLKDKIKKCEQIYLSYEVLKKQCTSCKPTDTIAERAAKVACLTALLAGRREYLKEDCDYVLPGSIKRGSDIAKKGHEIQADQVAAMLRKCSTMPGQKT